MSKNQYGILKRNTRNKSKTKYFIIAFSILFGWIIFFSALATQRVASAFGYHPDLGKPIFNNFYSPFKIYDWYPYLKSFPEILKMADQCYIVGIGVPMAFFVYMLYHMKSLKGRDDLHGSSHWATSKEVKKMGYVNIW